MCVLEKGKKRVSARSSTDRASDYGSEGLGFESLRAHFFLEGNVEIIFLRPFQCHKSVTDESLQRLLQVSAFRTRALVPKCAYLIKRKMS